MQEKKPFKKIDVDDIGGQLSDIRKALKSVNEKLNKIDYVAQETENLTDLYKDIREVKKATSKKENKTFLLFAAAGALVVAIATFIQSIEIPKIQKKLDDDAELITKYNFYENQIAGVRTRVLTAKATYEKEISMNTHAAYADALGEYLEYLCQVEGIAIKRLPPGSRFLDTVIVTDQMTDEASKNINESYQKARTFRTTLMLDSLKLLEIGLNWTYMQGSMPKMQSANKIISKLQRDKDWLNRLYSGLTLFGSLIALAGAVGAASKK